MCVCLCMWVIDCLSIYRLTYMGVLHIKMPYRSVFENRFRVDKLFHEFPHHGDSTPVEVNPHDPFRKGMCKKWLRIFCPDCTRTRTSSFCFSLMFGNLCDLRLAKMDWCLACNSLKETIPLQEFVGLEVRSCQHKRHKFVGDGCTGTFMDRGKLQNLLDSNSMSVNDIVSNVTCLHNPVRPVRISNIVLQACSSILTTSWRRPQLSQRMMDHRKPLMAWGYKNSWVSKVSTLDFPWFSHPKPLHGHVATPGEVRDARDQRFKTGRVVLDGRAESAYLSSPLQEKKDSGSPWRRP